MLPILWVACAVVIIGAALRAGRSEKARSIGRAGVGALYLGAGAAVNLGMLLRGDDYEDFANGAYVDFVRDTWGSLVVPNHHWFIGALIVFEAAVGLLALSGGRRTQLAYAAAIAFHIALLSFGWGFYLWSIPMIAAFAALLRAERQPQPAPFGGAIRLGGPRPA